MDHSFEKMERRLEDVLKHTGELRQPLGDVSKECEKHGAYLSTGTRYMGKREVWTRCPGCEQDFADNEKAQAEARRQEYAKAQLESCLQEAAIPVRFVGRTFENFVADTEQQIAALTVARDYAEQFEANAKRGNSLIFSGLPGTGKSHLAAAVLQSLMPKHCGLYTTCMGVIRNVRGTWRKDSERSETEVLRTYAEVPLLVIDEIGVQYGTDGEQTILFDVLDRRYRDMMPSIFLTNQDKKGFKDFIGERTFDRLTETARWVPFDWASYRPKARKESM